MKKPLNKLPKPNEKLMRLASLALVTALIFSTVIFTSTAAEATTDLKLWYNEPASGTSNTTNDNGIWQSSTLPIGNGKIGANIYGEIDTEHLTVNEETLWSGGNYSTYNGGNIVITDDTWNTMASAMAGGKSITTSNIQGSSEGYYNGYQPLGDLYFSFGHSDASNYTRELDLKTGISTVSYTYGGVTYTREYFADHDDNVIVARLTSTGSNNLSFTTSFETAQTGSSAASVSDNIGYITCGGTVSDNGLLHNTQLAVIPQSGSVSVSDGKIAVSGADSVTVILTAATDYATTFSSGDETYYYRTGETAEALSTRVSGVLAVAVGKGYTALKQTHSDDYTELYGRVDINLGGSNSLTTDALLSAYSNGTATTEQQRYLEMLQYQYGRYLLISASREDSQIVTTLQGIWNNNTSAPWCSDIHTNINLEMNYWLAGAGNLSECLKPLVEYMNAMYEPGNATVQAYTSAVSGMMMHTQNTPFGYTAPGWSYSWGWSPSAATWLLQNCYDYFEYTQDIDYLRSTLYPLLEKQVAMYDSLLVEKDGKLIFPISVSPEIGDVTAGNTYEQSLIWQLYTDTIEAAGILGYSAAAMQNTLDRLYINFIGTTTSDRNGVSAGSSYIKEWYDETDYVNSYNSSDTSHRHISQMLGVYPGNILNSLGVDRETAVQAAINTLTLRGTNLISGWSLAQRACTWAALGRGDDAYTYIKYVLTNGVMQNLWGYHSYSGYGGENKAFQIDANYGYSAAVNEMLLQSNYGYIDLIPAIPSAWSSGSFTGLAAEGDFDVDCAWTDGKVTAFSITSNSGGSCSVKYNLPDFYVIKDDLGNVVECTESNGIITFATTAGRTYTAVSTVSSLNVTVSVTRDDNNATLTWNEEAGKTYILIRKPKK